MRKTGTKGDTFLRRGNKCPGAAKEVSRRGVRVEHWKRRGDAEASAENQIIRSRKRNTF